MFYTCIGQRTYKIIRLKNVKRQSLSQRHPKREDVVAVTGDRRIIKLEGRGQNPAICPKNCLSFSVLFFTKLLMVRLRQRKRRHNLGDWYVAYREHARFSFRAFRNHFLLFSLSLCVPVCIFFYPHYFR